LNKNVLWESGQHKQFLDSLLDLFGKQTIPAFVIGKGFGLRCLAIWLLVLRDKMPLSEGRSAPGNRPQ
jgi:hypothetical protein